MFLMCPATDLTVHLCFFLPNHILIWTSSPLAPFTLWRSIGAWRKDLLIAPLGPETVRHLDFISILTALGIKYWTGSESRGWGFLVKGGYLLMGSRRFLQWGCSSPFSRDFIWKLSLKKSIWFLICSLATLKTWPQLLIIKTTNNQTDTIYHFNSLIL